MQKEFSEISILIPGYSVEDLPTDLGEDDAGSLLNAVACAWHPNLLVRSSGLPIFRQAESLYGYPGRRVILVPQCAESWMPHEWRTVLKEQDHVIIDRCTQRDEWLAAIESQITPATQEPEAHSSAPVLVEHFLALGTVLLQLQILSRRRHHFVDPDRILLEREVQAAAEASCSGAESVVREHLQRCFEHLRDIREKVFPQPCWLVDICVPSEDEDPQLLLKAVQESPRINLLASGRDLDRWHRAAPELTTALRARCESGDCCLLTGHDMETRVNLGSMAAFLSDLARCRETMAVVLHQQPRHWARRRFGMTASTPAVLRYYGFESALHVALDDGLYPDREQSQFEWQAPDGSLIPAASRIPLAIDSSAGFQRLPDRFNESMQEDPVAALFLARLPEQRQPWLRDLQNAAHYAPVLGEFVTLDQLVTSAEGSRLSDRNPHSDYLSPALIQSSVLKTEPPVSGPAELRQLWQRLESTRTLAALVQMVRGDVKSLGLFRKFRDLDRQLAERELLQVDTSQAVPEKLPALHEIRDAFLQSCSTLTASLMTVLQSRIPTDTKAARGLLLVNPLPFARQHEQEWPADWRRVKADSSLEAVENARGRDRLMVKMPPGGFVWLSESDGPADVQATWEIDRREPPLAERLILRNRHFEVKLNDGNGGIESVCFHHRRGNRLSQQVTFRYERDQKYHDPDSNEPARTQYAFVQLVSERVIAAGPIFASVETVSQAIAPSDGARLGQIRQLTTVDRFRSRIMIDVTLEDIDESPRGNPWLTGWCCRFAWDNEASTVIRSVLGQAAEFRLERIESSDYIEISDEQQRVVIVPDGRPWHRRSGPRMLDSLLVVEGETSRSFRFFLDFDQAFPLRSAEDMLTPVFALETNGQIPKSMTTSWILGVSSKNVQLVRAEYMNRSPQTSDELSVILSETEGLETRCAVKLARRPTAAFVVNATRSEKYSLEVSSEGVTVTLLPFQMKEVLLVF